MYIGDFSNFHIILFGIVFVEMLISISFGVEFVGKSKELKISGRFSVMCLFYAIACGSYILSALLSVIPARFICHLIMNYCQIVFICNVGNVGLFLIDERTKAYSLFTTVFYYLGILSLGVDIFFFSGNYLITDLDLPIPEMTKGYTNVPNAILHVMYLGVIIYILYVKAPKVIRKRERYLFHKSILAMLPVFIGILTEIGLSHSFGEVIPLSMVFSIITLIYFRYLIYYHRRLQFVKEDFEDALNPTQVTPMLVCDDKRRVLFINRRAEVESSTTRIEYVGRLIEDIFMVNDDIEQIFSTNTSKAYGITASSTADGKKVELLANPVLDRFGEVFCNIVNIVDYYVVKRDESGEALEGDRAFEETDDRLSITSETRALIIDENAAQANVMEGMLRALEMNVLKAFSDNGAMLLLRENEFDLIVIASMSGEDFGVEMATAIRKLGGTYYTDIPIIFYTDADISNVFQDFLNVGFNDYLNLPLSAKEVKNVMSRWAWKKQQKDAEGEFDKRITVISDRFDMRQEIAELIDDFDAIMDKKDITKLLYCLAGIKKIATIMNNNTLAIAVMEIESAALYEDENDIMKRLVSFRRAL